MVGCSGGFGVWGLKYLLNSILVWPKLGDGGAKSTLQAGQENIIDSLQFFWGKKATVMGVKKSKAIVWLIFVGLLMEN